MVLFNIKNIFIAILFLLAGGVFLPDFLDYIGSLKTNQNNNSYMESFYRFLN
jgi:hypothetical protein